MRKFHRLLLWEFLPFFLLGVAFFALILILADIFANLWRYLNNDVPFLQALLVSFYYGPKAVSFALPIGGMFAAAFALGTLGARNELIAVFGSGIPLIRFVTPILVFAAILSIGGYLFDDNVAIPMLKQRNALSNDLLGIQDSKNRSRTSAITHQGKVVYFANYYNDTEKELSGLTVLILGENDSFEKRIDAETALWDDGIGQWQLKGIRIFSFDSSGDIVQTRYSTYTEELLDEEPKTFGLETRDFDEMKGREVRIWIESQRRSGIPYKAKQAEYFQRFTTALTPFLVVLFAGSLGGRFKRNILLMSLLASLGISAAWYIVRMVSTLLSQIGLVPPLAGAVIPYLMFLMLGIWLFRHART